MTFSNGSRPQRLCLLGATGSVGTSTLDVVARHPERFEVVALTAHGRADALFEQCLRWRPRFAVLPTVTQASALQHRLAAAGVRVEVLAGPQALCELAAHPEVDTVMAAIVGAAGLAPCLAAAHAGKRLLLANKEALVVGGRLFMDAVVEGGATLLPIDSEHSAIFQCLPTDHGCWQDRVAKLVLTASGGPFRGRHQDELADVTPDDACAHPVWAMGRKISVDSATLMNKALEVIEAHHLFGFAADAIEVVVHPQSVVHSMVVCRDGSVLAQLGTPDMRVPIAVGLAWPERIASGAKPPDWLTLAPLTFETADRNLYPALGLAYDALAAPSGTSAVLNAANEVGVESFLAGTVAFPSILTTNARTVEALVPPQGCADSVESLLALDAEARSVARRFLERESR